MAGKIVLAGVVGGLVMGYSVGKVANSLVTPKKPVHLDEGYQELLRQKAIHMKLDPIFGTYAKYRKSQNGHEGGENHH